MKSIKLSGKNRKAFTIIDVMIAVTILLIAVLGTSIYRYNADLSARKANLQATAVRTALLICESWDGSRGSKYFNPDAAFSSNLNISPSEGPETPADFTVRGSYTITIEGVNYYATLSWKNLAGDLRALSVVIDWDSSSNNIYDFSKAVESYRMIAYVENPIIEM